jgi:hypothetical protein
MNPISLVSGCVMPKTSFSFIHCHGASCLIRTADAISRLHSGVLAFIGLLASCAPGEGFVPHNFSWYHLCCFAIIFKGQRNAI